MFIFTHKYNQKVTDKIKFKIYQEKKKPRLRSV